MMFLGLIFFGIIIFGFILFLFGVASKGSKLKWFFFICGALLMGFPYMMSLLHDYGNKQNGAKLSGSYYSETNLGTDILTINKDGTFKILSTCNNDQINGEWEYDYDDFERFKLECDNSILGYAFISNNSTWLKFGSKNLCSTDSKSIFRKRDIP